MASDAIIAARFGVRSVVFVDLLYMGSSKAISRPILRLRYIFTNIAILRGWQVRLASRSARHYNIRLFNPSASLHVYQNASDKKDKVVAEYALIDTKKPITSSAYKLTQSLPKIQAQPANY